MFSGAGVLDSRVQIASLSDGTLKQKTNSITRRLPHKMNDFVR